MTRKRLPLGLLAAALLGVAASPAMAAGPPVGMARVWFLRLYEPNESLATPAISVNAAPFALSRPGTVFFRDFAPGDYRFAVASYGVDAGQAETLRLAAGDRVYLEVQSLSSWSLGCDYGHDTFYVRQLTAEWAGRYLPQMTDLGAR
jgi:hypothetical protein